MSNHIVCDRCGATRGPGLISTGWCKVEAYNFTDHVRHLCPPCVEDVFGAQRKETPS